MPRRVREQSFGVCIVNEWNNLPNWVVEAEDLDKFMFQEAQPVSVLIFRRTLLGYYADGMHANFQ